MPTRRFDRSDAWLLPPSLESLIARDHPARFVAALIDQLSRAQWLAMGIHPEGKGRGAPGYAPRGLLGAWLFGLMTGIRTTRRLEQACAESLPFLWLTAAQRPDHNTLWRFYQAHRTGLGQLFAQSVRTAVHVGAVDLAVQAVDGTKVRGSVARASLRSAAGLQLLLEGVDEVLAQVDSQHAGDGGGEPPRLPPALQDEQARQQQIAEALEQVQRKDGPERISLTDPDARLQKLRGGGYAVGYNGQAAAAGLMPEQTDGVPGVFLTAVGMTNAAHDHEQLAPMLTTVEATTEQSVPAVLADSGYFSSATLQALEAEYPDTRALVPDSQAPRADQPYHKDRFTYDPDADTMTCPEGQTLPFSGIITRPGHAPDAPRYRAARSVCAACRAFAVCARSAQKGRSVTLRPDDARLLAHRARMATDAARDLYKTAEGADRAGVRGDQGSTRRAAALPARVGQRHRRVDAAVRGVQLPGAAEDLAAGHAGAAGAAGRRSGLMAFRTLRMGSLGPVHDAPAALWRRISGRG
jgi:transposase